VKTAPKKQQEKKIHLEILMKSQRQTRQQKFWRHHALAVGAQQEKCRAKRNLTIKNTVKN